MSFYYLASVYSHKDHEIREKRYRDALQAVHTLTARGSTVYSPIVHYHNVAKKELPTDFLFWRPHNMVMLSKSAGVYVLDSPAISTSVGVLDEIKTARRIHLPVYRLSVPYYSLTEYEETV